MKHFNPLSALLLSIPATFLFFDITNSGRAVAQTIPPCLPSHTTAYLQFNGGCSVGAETYGITIYKFALCTSDPLSSSAPDLRSCKTLFEKESGEYVDLANYSNFKLGDLDLTEVKGIYNYIYVQLGTTWNIKAKATVSSGTWYTSTEVHPGGQSKATQNISNFTVFADVMSSLSSGNIDACEANNDHGGKLAILTSALQPITFSSGTCAGAAYAVASANATSLLGSPVSITDKTKIIDLKFLTTQSSIGLWVDAGGTYLLASDGFTMTLNTSE